MASLRALDADLISRLARSSSWADGRAVGFLIKHRVLSVDPRRITNIGRMLVGQVESFEPYECWLVANALVESVHRELHDAEGCPELPIRRDRMRLVVDDLVDVHGADALRLLLSVGADSPNLSDMPAWTEAAAVLLTDDRLRLAEWDGWPVPAEAEGLFGPGEPLPKSTDERSWADLDGDEDRGDGAEDQVGADMPEVVDDPTTWDEWTAAVADLRERQVAVRSASERLTATIRDGRVPEPELLAAVEDYRVLQDRLIRSAAEQGHVTDVAITLDDLEQSLLAARLAAEAAVAQELDASTRVALQLLADGLVGPEDLDVALGTVAELAGGLLGTEALDAEALDVALALQRLAELVPSGDDAAPAGLDDVRQLRDRLPVALHPVLRALPFGEVRFASLAPTEVAGSAPEPAPAAITDAAPDPAVQPTPEAAPPRPRRPRRPVAESATDVGGEAIGEPSAESSRVSDRLLAASIRAEAFGLAARIAEVVPGAEVRGMVLRMLAFASAMRSGTGSSAAAYRKEVEAFSMPALAGERGLQLLALASAVRASIIIPFAGAADVLNGIARTVDDPEVSEVLHQLAINEGVVPPIASERATQVRDQAQLEREIAQQARACAELAERVQKLTAPFQRATRVWRHWVQPEGVLGDLLAVAAGDDRARLDHVARCLLQLGDRRDIEALLDQTDEELTGRHRERIIATARDWMLRRTEEVLDAVRAWHDAADDARGDGEVDEVHGSRFQHLQSVIRSSSGRVADWFAQQADGADEFDSACAEVARAHVAVSFRRLVDVERIPGPELAAHLALNLDLVRVLSMPLDGVVRPRGPEPLTVEVLGAALEVSWREAFEGRDAEGNHEASRAALDQLQVGGIDAGELAELRDRSENRLAEGRAGLARGFAECESALARARLHRHIVADGGVEDERALEDLALRLEILRPAPEVLDVASVRVAQEAFLEELGLHLDQAREALRAEFERLVGDGVELEVIRGRFERNLERGELDTARELLDQARSGTVVPELPELGARFAAFHPHVVEQVASGELRERNVRLAAKKGEVTGPLDFGDLASDERDGRVLPALAAWANLKQLGVAKDGAGRIAAGEDVRAVLSLVGLVPLPGQGAFERDRRARQDGDHSWFRLPLMEPRAESKVPVPQFGTLAGNQYRVLVAWSGPKLEQVIERIRADHERHPVIVLYVGTLDVRARVGLRREAWRAQIPTPFIVVDEPVVLQLAALGRGFLTDALELTLPFTALDPYMPDALGNLPPEVFYGRDRELESVQDPFGSHFIYGGRQFGKSVLLRAAQRNFRLRGDGHVAVYEDLKARGLGVNRLPSDLVDVLSESLRVEGIEIRRPRARETAADEFVEDLRAWCDGDPERRLLILLDEADDFLEADSPRFATVQFIKRLFDATDRRVKPVLAGLHQVQRFTKVDSNNPFAHLGEHLRIGSLAPAAAADLLLRPLSAIGLRFEDDDLVARVLGRTNFQPASIQLMGKAVLRYAHDRAASADGPPMVITSRDIDEILSDEQLAAEIRKRFDLTMALDQRYRVITYVMAHNAHEGGLDVRYSASDLYEQCRAWAPAGFAGIGSEDFALLVGELVDLGVLSHDRRRRSYAMRSPNILRLLGDREAIEEELLRASELEMQPRYDLSLFRRLLTDPEGRRSPLPEQRVMRIVGASAIEAPQVHVFLTSELLSGDLVMKTVSEVARNEYGTGMTWRTARHDSITERLREIRTADKQKAFLGVDLTEADEAAAVRALHRLGESDLSGLATIVVMDAAKPALWADLLLGREGRLPDAVVESLTRWSRASLATWARHVDPPVTDAGTLERILEVTGGWPLLMDRLAVLRAEVGRWELAVDEFRRRLDGPETDDGEFDLSEARTVVAASGLRPSTVHARVFEEIVELGLDFRLEDVIAHLRDLDGLGDVDLGATIAVLRAMQVLDLTPSPDGTGELVGAEPVIAAAWRLTARSR